MEPTGDIFVLPFFGQGHLNPAMELCRNISSHNYNVTLIIPSHLSSSIPSTFKTHSSLIHVTEIKLSAPPPDADPGHPLEQQIKLMGDGLRLFLSESCRVRSCTCVVIDVMMSWSKEFFFEYKVPVVSFFTSGATFSAMDYGRWKANVADMKPGDVREIPGLPKEMSITFSDLSNKGPRGGGGGPTTLDVEEVVVEGVGGAGVEVRAVGGLDQGLNHVGLMKWTVRSRCLSTRVTILNTRLSST